MIQIFKTEKKFQKHEKQRKIRDLNKRKTKRQEDGKIQTCASFAHGLQGLWRSTQKITDKILNTLELLGDFPYMGALHPDQELGGREFRKVLCGDYVCVYKVIQSSVFVYRIVNGKTDYPKLLK